MPKLSAIQNANETANITVDFGNGNAVDLVIYPNKLTGKRAKAMQALPEGEEEEEEDERNRKTDGYVPVRERRAELFFSVIKEWNLADENDKPLSFSSDTIDELSVPTSMHLWGEIMEAVNPKQKSGRRSHGR